MAKNRKKQKIRKFITTELLFKYQKELDELVSVRRKQVAVDVRESREKGGVKNNPLYDRAKDTQRKMEARIDELRSIIHNAVIIEENDIILDKVMLGSVVKVHNLEYDEFEKYTIVDASNVNSLKGKISNESPLGKALVGQRVGQIVSIKTPVGVLQYKIIEIMDFLSEYSNQQTMQETSNDENSSVDTIDILPQHFLTRVHIFHCSDENHNIVDIMCRIKISLNTGIIDTILIPGGYCDTCKRFFILEREYEKLKAQGIPLCKVVEKDFWINGNENVFWGLNKESVLHMMGYNVNVQENLTTKQRWRILEVIVDEGILTIAEVRSHLEWLIHKSHNNPNFEKARTKWECDSKHMAEYEKLKKKIIDVASITKNNYRKK